ncbi:SidA/IucD/PvdA family monooxygenase [Catellatospora coxensis]|uniref:L-lysine N6-monooxygenase MbtG n=1 Tax=Catellatospora coxensis TaxID=310354 RepID=A0A8J3PBI2_9ACTN|nr:SidA/IucD/PvdA family monooxygenase [Catellatospora coxensis]GIG11371.1 L-lysine 6-monooxygenase [Catellatospora coxensis]
MQHNVEPCVDSDDDTLFDTIGVGFGPANIALAVAHSESQSGRSLAFLEANAGPTWQPGMLLDGSDIQHNPLRDFITPVNPCSRFGFLSYLKSQQRLFHFLNLDAPYPPRADYERYVRWVADQFAEQVRYSERVVAISLSDDPDPATGKRTVQVDTQNRTLRARSLSFAPGRSWHVPELFRPALGDAVFHANDYVVRREDWKKNGAPASVAVIGSSQSAVEIILDLHASLPGTVVNSVFRNFSYVLKDTSPFTEDLLFPSHTDYFYSASPVSKKRLTEQVLRSNYGSVDHDVIKKLYFTLYENSVRDDSSIVLRNNAHVTEVALVDGGVLLSLLDEHDGSTAKLHVDAVVLATGFRNFGTREHEELCHPLLEQVADAYEKDDDGTLRVTRSYQLVPADDGSAPAIFLNGLCESSHGLGDAGSFSLLSYRAAEVERALAAFLTGP